MLRYDGDRSDTKVLYPDLANDRALLLERLAGYLESVVLDFAEEEVRSSQLASVLSGMDKLPVTASQPYRDQREDPRAFEPLARRPTDR